MGPPATNNCISAAWRQRVPIGWLENLAQLFDRAVQYEEPKGTSTNRQRLLIRLAAFQRVALRAGHIEELRQTCERLLEELRRR